MPHGKLTVVVEGATDIKTLGVYGRGSSFCTLTCGTQVFSSPTIEGGGSHPFFNTEFEFEIDRTTNELNVSVYSKDSSRDDEMVGYCTLNFKKVFYHGHTVPLTAYSIQQPSGNPGGKIKLSFNFKMRTKPNGHNAHVPMRCSPPPPPHVSHNIIGRQTLSLDWGYDCHEEGASEAQNCRRTKSKPLKDHENYLNLPGTASDHYQETKPGSFVRYGNPTEPRPRSPQTPKPRIQYNQPIPGKPRPRSAQTPKPRIQYNQPIPGKPQPQVIFQPQVQLQVQERPGVLYHVAGEAANGFAEGFGGELANQVLGGVGEAILGGLFNF